MKFKDFIDRVDDIKSTKLGGKEAQFKMAPELRIKFDETKIKAYNPKRAAVLALFYPNKQQNTTLLLTQRASYRGTHSAQISFPGGKLDNNDNSLKETALRETFEEVGVQSSSIKIIKELTDVYIPPSNFLATPFLGYTTKRPDFLLNYEVDKAIEILLSDLLNDKHISTVNLTTSYMKNVDVPCFNFNNNIVWGATGMMLSEIKELLK